MANNIELTNQQNGGDHVSVEMGDANRVLTSSIKEKLAGISPSPSRKKCCIYKLHEKFRKIKEYAYTPEMVSIGPFHHGKIGLRAMEDHKLRYMHMLLSRTEDPDAKLEECVVSISEVEEKARKCYSVPIDLNREKFIEMLVVDSLFIIELFGKSAGMIKIEKDDTIFSNIWCLPSLVRDMILLENQLPMLVLDRLFKIVEESIEDIQEHSFNELALRFFNPLMQREDAILQKYFNNKGKHLLDLVSTTFHASSPVDITRKLNLKHIPCVTELRQAGVKFKKGSTTGSFVDIKFDNGVMEIPPILIQDQTDTLLRNLIASEQCCNGRSTYMTSYAFLMDRLINSSEDVSFLRKRGIITNYLGDDEDVACLFNKLCSEVTLVNFYYSDLCVRVNDYYKTRWHTWQATLKRDYFHNPWAIISFVGAIVLLGLTLTSVVFASLSYFVHKS